MLSNAYFLAKFRFDTAENEPAKNLQKFVKFANFTICRADLLADEGELRAEGVRALVQAELVFLGLRARGAAGLRQIADKIGTAFDKLDF